MRVTSNSLRRKLFHFLTGAIQLDHFPDPAGLPHLHDLVRQGRSYPSQGSSLLAKRIWIWIFGASRRYILIFNQKLIPCGDWGVKLVESFGRPGVIVDCKW